MMEKMKPIIILVLILLYFPGQSFAMSQPGLREKKKNARSEEPKEPPADEPVFCTMDAKMCPDGSFVGRVPPDCRFAPCPAEKKSE